MTQSARKVSAGWSYVNRLVTVGGEVQSLPDVCGVLPLFSKTPPYL